MDKNQKNECLASKKVRIRLINAIEIYYKNIINKIILMWKEIIKTIKISKIL